MSASLKAIDGNADLPALMNELAARARAAARVLSLAPSEQKSRALKAMERAIRENAQVVLAANAEDVAEARGSGITAAFLDRLTLTAARVSFAGIWQGKGQSRPLLLNTPAGSGKFTLYTPSYGNATPHESGVVEAVKRKT